MNRVAEKYDLKKRIRFSVNAESCEWIEESHRWRISYRDLKTGIVSIHESQFLYFATGQLEKPREIDIPGSDTFEGPIFHTARWRKDVNLKDKKVVVFGNGCTGAQVVPAIVKETQSLTQFVRSKHWIFPPIDKRIPPSTQTVLKKVPGLMGLARLVVFLVTENDLRGFTQTKAAQNYRDRKRRITETYMRETAPEKYHDILIPDFEVGCKRRIFDAGYLESLHSENLTLTNEKPLEIVPSGVRTDSGVVEADVIILANGFVTNDFLPDMEIRGQRGQTIQQHWESYGGVEAYNCSALSGFPNMFMLLGPNSATGHTSAIIASENSINYSLRVIRPVLEGRASEACLKSEAEREYSNTMQGSLKDTVWSGCQSWYNAQSKINSGRTWNAMTYPWSQAHYWYRSFFPVWSDWVYTVCSSDNAFLSTKSRDTDDFQGQKAERPRRVRLLKIALIAIAITGASWGLWGRRSLDQVPILRFLLQYIPAQLSNSRLMPGWLQKSVGSS